MTTRRSKRSYEGTLQHGVRQRVNRQNTPSLDEIGDEDTPESVALQNAHGVLHRDMFLLRHPESYTDKESLRDAMPPPPGYCYTLDGRLVPLLEVRLPLEDPNAQAIFCEVLEVTGSMRAACDTLGIRSQKIIMDFMIGDPNFAESVEIAADRHRQQLYAIALQRATVGHRVPIIGGPNKDEIVAYETKFSDTLLVLLLKRFFPEFRDINRPAVQINNTLNVSMPNVRELSREKRALMLQLLEDTEPPTGDLTAVFDEAETVDTSGLTVIDVKEN